MEAEHRSPELRPSPSSLVDDDLARQLARDHFGEPLILKPWECDVIRAHAQLIEIYNNCGSNQPEAKFCNVQGGSRRLRDLLWEDWTWLAEKRPHLKKLAPHLTLLELSGVNPNAHAFTTAFKGEQIHVIAFRSPLIRLINSAFSKMWCLLHPFRHADCLEQFDEQIESDRYSCTSLLAGIYNDVESLFELGRIFIPFEPPHIANPYEYCERVEGARRFILAHETSHLFYVADHQEAAYVSTMAADGISESTAKAWYQELWCDVIAIEMILDNYSAAELHGPLLYELSNALIGSLNFLFLLDAIEPFLRDRDAMKATHPTASMRITNLVQTIVSHRHYLENSVIGDTFDCNMRALNGFRSFTGGGLDTPLWAGNHWNYHEFQDRLSPFGLSVYRLRFSELLPGAKSLIAATGVNPPRLHGS